jgi:hypothetical protein
VTSVIECCCTQLIWRDVDYTSTELFLGGAAVGVHGTKGNARSIVFTDVSMSSAARVVNECCITLCVCTSDQQQLSVHDFTAALGCSVKHDVCSTAIQLSCQHLYTKSLAINSTFVESCSREVKLLLQLCGNRYAVSAIMYNS